MPVQLSSLARDSRTIELPVGDEVVTITYRPGGVTPQLEDELRDYATDQRGGAALVALLASCVVEWDILDDNGKPLKPTPANLRRLPTVFLGQVTQAIMEDMRPNPQSDGRSVAG